MAHEKEKLAEKMMLFLYVLSPLGSININTFRRYVYLYYITSSFINGNSDNVVINLDKGSIKIMDFDLIIDEFLSDEFIVLNENDIIVNPALTERVNCLIGDQDGAFYESYRMIDPFINLLRSYDDQFIFTIFFSEPTFREASQRGVKEVTPKDSKLSKLLQQFKDKIDNDNIDEYDILTYWMDFILKNYYQAEE